MTSMKTGIPAGAAKTGQHIPDHYLRRVARSTVIRAAVRGRISWHVAFAMLAKIEGGTA